VSAIRSEDESVDSAAALVALALDDMPNLDEDERDALLADLVCISWPSPRALSH